MQFNRAGTARTLASSALDDLNTQTSIESALRKAMRAASLLGNPYWVLWSQSQLTDIGSSNGDATQIRSIIEPMLPDGHIFDEVGKKVIADYMKSRSTPDAPGKVWVGSIMQMETIVEGGDRVIKEGIAPPDFLEPHRRFTAMYRRIKDQLQHYLISIESA